MATTTTSFDWSALFTALAPALATMGGLAVEKLVPESTTVGADAQKVLTDLFTLAGDIIKAKSATPAASSVVVPATPAA